MSLHQPITAASRITRSMSVQDALAWAFLTEKAVLDFDQYGAHEFDRPGVDTIWIMAERHKVGVNVDGGGTSDPHPDAQIIAAAVEALPDALGGRKMATQIAELARARSAPDWGQGERLAITPCGWDWDNDQGCFVAGVSRTGSLWVWRDRHRNKREHKGDVCAISYTGTASMAAAKRRNYLAWCGALLDLWAVLRRDGVLDTITITDVLPPLAPWREVGGMVMSQGKVRFP
ncbi:hypothetical protein E4191_07680 [Paracoccus liaowanqingii]|uniref:Uncharacterized protein n=1 Tax=Paracoccus liaowanqingii TaxID=2560053 RepID=A0A4P7HKB8_9RHOB|nr:hypothetical protein [Paracoccus liaowanqingii]QBX34604.1 hypothetical protein E4191_07680 [Paracoccus liaowanqingii]